MPRAVRFDRYGPEAVLDVVEVPRPAPARGEALVQVVTSSINPGEITIREGGIGDDALPSGQGSDLAGRIVELGEGAGGWSVGEEVIGWTDSREAQADYVNVPAGQLTTRPPAVSWEQAGSLYVAGCTAYGMVEAVAPRAGETVAVAGAAGGVGSIAIQLLRARGAHVLGIAGPANDDWLAAQGVQPVNYGYRFAERLRATAPDGIDALLDAHGDGYVQLAFELGVPAERIVTIIDFEAAEARGAKIVFGHEVASAEMLGELAAAIDRGELAIPIAATFPLEQVREAYARLAERHTQGKIVLTIAA